MDGRHVGNLQQLTTLGKGRKATEFMWRDDEEGITVAAGSRLTLSHSEILEMLSHFGHGRWFPLGASMTEPTPGGLGEYFRVTLGKTPRFASHFAAVLVRQNRLLSRDEGNAIMLKVV